MATHGRSSSLPAMDVAGGERTGGAPPLAAMAPRGARRGTIKEAGREREQSDAHSGRGSRRRESGAAPARSSATAGAVRRGDEIGQPDGVGVVIGVVLGKNGEMGTTVLRRGYIYPAHWSRFVSPTGTKGQHWYRLVAQTGTKGVFQHPKGRETETFGAGWWHQPVPMIPFGSGWCYQPGQPVRYPRSGAVRSLVPPRLSRRSRS